ncbi:MAG: hypothetical protein E7011_01455 [Alphaproteobacteria bacterium]|nr:hypothetical protein [Alphaproteobacteria bacterium]
MNFVKKYFKIFVGVAVLLMTMIVFFFAQRSSDLETGSIKDWRAASMDRRVAAVRIITGADKNIDVLVACVDKIATLPDSNEVMVQDAVRLCHTGMQMKESM